MNKNQVKEYLEDILSKEDIRQFLESIESGIDPEFNLQKIRRRIDSYYSHELSELEEAKIWSSFMKLLLSTQPYLLNSFKALILLMFDKCRWLTHIDIPNNIENIGKYAFMSSGLKEITIPKSITKIDSFAFAFCDSLESVTVSGPTHIGENSFRNCPKLNYVKLNPGVVLDSSIFNGCFDLKEIIFDGTKEQWHNVLKDQNWKYRSYNITTIKCTDGDIEL